VDVLPRPVFLKAANQADGEGRTTRSTRRRSQRQWWRRKISCLPFGALNCMRPGRRARMTARCRPRRAHQHEHGQDQGCTQDPQGHKATPIEFSHTDLLPNAMVDVMAPFSSSAGPESNGKGHARHAWRAAKQTRVAACDMPPKRCAAPAQRLGAAPFSRRQRVQRTGLRSRCGPRSMGVQTHTRSTAHLRRRCWQVCLAQQHAWARRGSGWRKDSAAWRSSGPSDGKAAGGRPNGDPLASHVPAHDMPAFRDRQ